MQGAWACCAGGSYQGACPSEVGYAKCRAQRCVHSPEFVWVVRVPSLGGPALARAVLPHTMHMFAAIQHGGEYLRKAW